MSFAPLPAPTPPLMARQFRHIGFSLSPLQTIQGMPSQPQALGPLNGRLGCASHVHPVSSPQSHLMAEYRSPALKRSMRLSGNWNRVR